MSSGAAAQFSLVAESLWPGALALVAGPPPAVLRGVVPFTRRGASYNAPVDISLAEVPERQPTVMLRPCDGMQVVPTNPYVDQATLAVRWVLYDWGCNDIATDARRWLEGLSELFGTAPPLRALPVTAGCSLSHNATETCAKKGAAPLPPPATVAASAGRPSPKDTALPPHVEQPQPAVPPALAQPALPADSFPPSSRMESLPTSQPADCCVCLDNKASVACVPCGHVALCRTCKDSLQRAASGENGAVQCPICRVKCTLLMDLFA